MSRELRTSIKLLKEAVNDPTTLLEKLKELVTTMVDNPALNNLTARELRAFHGFRQTINACKNMTDESIRKHIYAHWEGGEVKQAITKLPIYKEAFKIYNEMMSNRPVVNTNPVIPKTLLIKDEIPAYLEK